MSKARGLADLGNVYDDGALSNRNLLINSAMQVAQRGTSATLTSGNFTLDRFKVQSSLLDNLVGTMTQDSDAPDGFANSLKITTTTVETAIAADEYFYVTQFIEAQNLQRLSFGSSAAKDITVSFWIKSTQTGVFAVSLYTADNAGIANSTYTISSASTWEYKTITFTGDTARAINNDNGLGMYVNFHLAAGTNFNSDPTDEAFEAYSDAKWAGGHVQNGVITTASATWQITGIQLEAGDTATPFEHRSYSDELARCQRYFQKQISTSSETSLSFCRGQGFASGSAYVYFEHPVEMRTKPSLSSSIASVGNLGALAANGGGMGISALTTVSAWSSVYTTVISLTVSSGTFTAGQATELDAGGNSGAFLSFDAEL